MALPVVVMQSLMKALTEDDDDEEGAVDALKMLLNTSFPKDEAPQVLVRVGRFRSCSCASHATTFVAASVNPASSPASRQRRHSSTSPKHAAHHHVSTCANSYMSHSGDERKQPDGRSMIHH